MDIYNARIMKHVCAHLIDFYASGALLLLVTECIATSSKCITTSSKATSSYLLLVVMHLLLEAMHLLLVA